MGGGFSAVAAAVWDIYVEGKCPSIMCPSLVHGACVCVFVCVFEPKAQDGGTKGSGRSSTT